MESKCNHEHVPYDAQAHQELIDYLKEVAPNRSWMNLYFDLVKDLLESTCLVNSDKRLVLTMPEDKGWRYFLPVIINTRYVLAAFYWKDNSIPAARFADYDDVVSVGMIYGRRLWDSMSLSERDKTYNLGIQIKELTEFYAHIQGEEWPPVYLHLKDISYANDFKSEWVLRSQIERERFTGSINRHRHRPVIYKATVDQEYRASVLNEAFP
jgi:5-methylcytosine-specific restriction protein A